MTPQIAGMIVDYAQTNMLKRGDHLPAQKLADEFRISRSPVNEALKYLEKHDVVRREPNRGYFLATEPDGISLDVPEAVNGEIGEEVYFQLADDRLSGKLPDRVTEKEIMQRYGTTRGKALKILHRMAREGWIERLPGKGWEFHATLTSAEAYEMAYLFRIAIEPAAILQRSFRIDTVAFRRAREQQQTLLDGEYLTLSRAELFRINSGFHEMIVDCSNNVYFIESIKRVNASRRLAEYRKTLDRTRLVGQSLEHIRILDLLEVGELEKAADFMRFHLEYALKVKTDDKLG
ncbi:GntR family transcriptional regulator [Pseudochelatococcus sp. B33]